MKISFASEADLPAIADLFCRSFLGEAQVYPTTKSDWFYVAKIGEEMVGAGKLYRNSLHANIPIMVIAVDPNHRQRSYGRALHEALVSSLSKGTFVDACSYETDSTGLSFIKALGYKSYLDCFIPVIDTSAVHGEKSPENFELMTLQQAYAKSVSSQDVLKFLVDHYMSSHGWNPPSLSVTDPRWEEVALGRVDPHISPVALSKGSLVGVSTGWIDDQILEIQWSYAKGSIEEQASILRALLTEQFSRARQRGVNTATLESDSTEPVLRNVVEGFKVISSKTWRRFRLDC